MWENIVLHAVMIRKHGRKKLAKGKLGAGSRQGCRMTNSASPLAPAPMLRLAAPSPVLPSATEPTSTGGVHFRQRGTAIWRNWRSPEARAGHDSRSTGFLRPEGPRQDSDERATWKKLWADVAALAQKAEGRK